MGCRVVETHKKKSAKRVRIIKASTNQPVIMTYFSNKGNHISVKPLIVSSEKLYVTSPTSVTTASSSKA